MDTEVLHTDDSFADEEDDDEDSRVPPLNTGIPRFALAHANRVWQGLTSPASCFSIDDLIQSIQSAHEVLSHDRSFDKERKEVQYFVADLLYRSFSTLLSDDFLRVMMPRHQQVFAAGLALVKFTALLGQQCQESLPTLTNQGMREECCGITTAMLTMNMLLECSLHRVRFLEQLGGKQNDSTAASEPPSVPPVDQWHAAFVREYIDASGMVICMQFLDAPTLVPMFVLECVTTLISKASSALAEHPETCSELGKVLARFSAYLDSCIEKDHDKLADGGRDRTYTMFSRMLECLYVACKDLTLSELTADTQVCQLQRHFVMEMLKSASFNKLLSAARECFHMLKRSAGLMSAGKGSCLKEHAQWLDQGSIVKQMLRANLHQKQYSDLVFSILQVLSHAGLIRAEHLDMLWAATEQEGTFDEIKVNVYQMIESLASGLSQPHLDLLFSKFQGRKGTPRSLQDTLRLLDLLRKLAKNDLKDAYMAERLLDMMWQLTTSADSPPEVLQSNVIADVLLQYRNPGYIEEYLARCVEQLRSKSNIYTALRVMYQLLHRCTSPEQRQQLLRKLETQNNIHQLLVDSLKEFMNVAARRDRERSAAASSSAVAGSQLPPLPPRPLGQGSWSYQDIVNEFMNCIRHVAFISQNYYSGGLAEQLWDLLVVAPVQPEDVVLGLSFLMNKEHTSVVEYLDLTTAQDLLSSRITKLDCEQLSPPAWECFWSYFVAVNQGSAVPRLQMHIISVPGPLPSQVIERSVPRVLHSQLSALEGLDYLWSLALSCLRSDVCSSAKSRLLQLYDHAEDQDQGQGQGAAPAAALFVDECTRRLRQCVDVLTGRVQRQGAALEPVLRCTHRLLCLLSTKLEADPGRTLPPIPSHRSSFRGQQVLLDVQVHCCPGLSKVKLQCHANEYVGLVRRRLARQLGLPPQRLRLLCGGDEWRSDTQLLAAHLAAPGRLAVVATSSLHDNAFTLQAPGFMERWRSRSAVRMLSRSAEVYDQLFLLADLPAAPEVRQEAVKLLQLLPTSSAIPRALRQALGQVQVQAHGQEPGAGAGAPGLLALLLAGAGSGAGKQGQGTIQPAKLLYSLQALHGLLFPLLPTADEDASPAPAPPSSSPALMEDAAEVDTEAVGPCSAAAEQAEPSSHRAPSPPPSPPLAPPVPCCPSVASSVVSLLIEVLQQLQQQQQQGGPALDATFLRELYAVSTHLMSNLVALHLELKGAVQQQQQQLQGGAARDPEPDTDTGMADAADRAAAAGAVGSGSESAAPAPAPAPVLAPVDPSSGSSCQPLVLVLDMEPSSGSSNTGGGAGGEASGSEPCTTPPPPAPPALGLSVCLAEEQSQSQGVAVDPCGTPLVDQCQALALGTPLGAGHPALSPGLGPGSAHTPDPAPQQLLPPASEAPLLLLSPELLAAAVSLLVRLTLQLGLLSQLQAPASGGGVGGVVCRDVDQVTDVQLVRECLSCLDRLLKKHPELYDVFLEEPRCKDMVRATLLNPALPLMRDSSHQLLKDICLRNKRPDACVWLLRTLCKLSQPLLEPQHCAASSGPSTSTATSTSTSAPFFSLFKDAVSSMPEDEAEATALAEYILQTEVNSLYHSAAMLTAAGSQPLLEGKLRLVKELVHRLDRISIGTGCDSDSQGLVQLLLKRYLFPEAATLAKESSFTELEVALDCCCSDPSTRRAAMELLVSLCTSSAAVMEEGLSVLHDIHFRTGPIIISKADLFTLENMRAPGGYVGLRNGGATCYMNAVLQQLFMQPRIRELVLGAALVPAEEQADSMFHQLQLVFAHLRFGRAGSVHPRSFWNSFKDYDGVPVDIKEHQDAYEFFTRLQDCVDQHLRFTGQTPAMHHIMGGSFAQQIICKDIEFRSEREEEFYQISVDVKGKGSLEKSLESYVQGELMEGENAYLCEAVGYRVTALKRTCIKELPQTLVIHLKRFEYDHLNMQRYKVRERFEFPVTLDMFRYTADGLEALEGSTAQVAVLTEAQRQQGVQPQPRHYYIYELKGMVVHSGTAFAGHYYSFIKERPRVQADGSVVDGKWFIFDDKSVREWSLERLDEDCYGGSSSSSGQQQERPYSAYMLFYERKASACFESKDIKMQVGTQHQAAQRRQSSAGAGAQAGPPSCAAAAAAPSSVLTPYGMPVEVYENVLRFSCNLILKLHVDSEDYSRVLIRQLVEGRGEVGRAARKSRRRKTHSLPAHVQPRAAAAGDSSSGRDSPSPSPATPAAADPPSSPRNHAPSQRSEEQELANCQSTRLATCFIMSILLASFCSRDRDRERLQAQLTALESWLELVHVLLGRGPRPCIALLQALLDCHPCMQYYLQGRCSLDTSLEFVRRIFWEAFRLLNDYFLPQVVADAAPAAWSQVVQLQVQFFTLLDRQVHNTLTLAAARSHLPPCELTHAFRLMREMLEDATPGSYDALAHGDGLSNGIKALVTMLEQQHSKYHSRYFDSIVSVSGFIRKVFDCVSVEVMIPILASRCRAHHGAQAVIATLPPNTARPRPGLPEPGFMLPPQQLLQFYHLFDTNPQLYEWLLEEPGLLAQPDVSSLLVLLSWEDTVASAMLLNAMVRMLQRNHDIEDSDHLCVTSVMSSIVNLVLAIPDTLKDLRIQYLCGLGEGGSKISLASFLANEDQPMLQLLSWWCIMSFAEHNAFVEELFPAWIQEHASVAERMAACGDQPAGLMSDESGYYSKDIMQRYKQVATYILRQLGMDTTG